MPTATRTEKKAKAKATANAVAKRKAREIEILDEMERMFTRSKTQGVVALENGKLEAFPKTEHTSKVIETLSRLLKEFSKMQKIEPEAVSYFAHVVQWEIDDHILSHLKRALEDWESYTSDRQKPVRMK